MRDTYGSRILITFKYFLLNIVIETALSRQLHRSNNNIIYNIK